MKYTEIDLFIDLEFTAGNEKPGYRIINLTNTVDFMSLKTQHVFNYTYKDFLHHLNRGAWKIENPKSMNYEIF